MAIGIYKQGQGYWTRLMTAIALGLVAFMGAIWLWDLMRGVRIEGVEPVYVSATGAVIFVAIIAIFGYYYVGLKPKTVDFMVATEGEMKKVHWSSRREILGSTWVVIGLTAFTAIVIAILDLLFSRFFLMVNVLETTPDAVG